MNFVRLSLWIILLSVIVNIHFNRFKAFWYYKLNTFLLFKLSRRQYAHESRKCYNLNRQTASSKAIASCAFRLSDTIIVHYIPRKQHTRRNHLGYSDNFQANGKPR